MTKRTKKDFGRHYLIEFIKCDPARIKRVKDVKRFFLKAARESRASIIQHFFYQFKPHGVSGVILIEESHFTVHTWPEDGYVGWDIQTCGKMYPERAIRSFKKDLRAQKVKIVVVKRGP